MLEDFKFTYSKLSTNGVKTFKIDEYKGKYYLHVEIKETTPLKAVQVKYNIKFVRKSNNLSVFAQQVKFEYGYEEANNDYINGLDKGDVIEVDNSNPIITDDQFDDIAKINDYKNVTLSGSDWKFTVNVTDESTKNFLFTNAGVKEVLAKFPEQEFKFFNFSGKPAFTATGKLELNVDDIVDEFDKMYVYRYANGKMYKLNASFDAEENTLSFRTNKLDTFVVTDKEIKDGTVVVENSSSDSSSDADKNNPETGASDAVNAAVAMAVASLATAGAVALKKFSK
ncbi:hypothetical protein [Youxingia wuxianensis]|uniref:Gram-positive cocci surface proteins LPxTG domain-containing protein n=1 Tax=Youxingia wuxianensis TaxID=2763678 RepID=A0A926IGZ6_9FIRM|nr:hypothetical protein [Youxingia wuxianensis]